MSGLDLATLNAALSEQFAPWVLDLDLEVVELSDTGATLKMQPGQRLHRTGGIVCGQALAAVADTAMVIALYAVTGRTDPCATVDINTSFLKPATTDPLLARAEIIRRGRSMAFARVLIESTRDGKAVASATATYAGVRPS